MDPFKINNIFFVTGPEQLTTIVHGELWENNILMASDLFHEGDGVKVVDWKNAKIASATLDLVRKLFKAHSDRLLDELLEPQY